jgi:hypothetical protein
MPMTPRNAEFAVRRSALVAGCDTERLPIIPYGFVM